ncbi:MAG: serine protease, partial [Phycisphaerae bacterium]
MFQDGMGKRRFRTFAVATCLSVLLGSGSAAQSPAETPVPAVSMGGSIAPRIERPQPPASRILTDATVRIGRALNAIPVSWDAIDLAAVRAEDAQQDAAPGVPMRIGVNRPTPFGVIRPDTDGEWRIDDDGAGVWAVELHIPDARGVRVHFSAFDLPEGARVLIHGSGDAAPLVYEGRGLMNLGAFWARLVDGPDVLIEYQDARDRNAAPLLAIDEISHIYRIEPLLGGAPAGRVADPHDAGDALLLPCQEDVNCYLGAPDNVPFEARDAVGRMIFTDGGTFVCTGSLLNDVDTNTFAGYFLTANHCISSQAVVNTLTVYWFYHSVICNGAAPSLVGLPSSSGGTLLANSSTTDFCFLRTANDPSDGQGFNAWTTNQPAVNDSVIGIHHPGGSFKRISFGFRTNQSPICGGLPTSKFLYNDWTLGVTEGGSSGSPLFNANYEVVGQLFGVCFFIGTTPGCSNPNDYNNVYGRFDQTFPAVSAFLNSIAPDDGFEDNDSLAQAPVIEPGVHNLQLVDFDDYFTLNLCGNGDITVNAVFNTGDMDLDLQLLDDGGGVISAATGAAGNKTVSVTNTAAGSYRIRAFKSAGWGGDYTLTITINAPCRLFVNGAGGGGDGSSWAQAMTDPQAAIDTL